MQRAALAVSLSLLPAVALAGPASNLPWISGSKGNSSSWTCLGTLRGTPQDVRHEHIQGGTNLDFPGMVSVTQGWLGNEIRNGPPYFLTSYALLPQANKGQFSQCAAGNFNSYWQQIGAALRAAAGSAHTVIVEPGFEAAIGSSSHPWGVDSASQLSDYKKCYQNAVSNLRASYPGVKITWNNARKFGTSAWTVAQMDPGVEDWYALMGYDNAPWSTLSSGTDGAGNPNGFTQWLAYAAGHGKPVGLSEWGAWKQGDDPNYIDKMAALFKANAGTGAGKVIYDAYQNNGYGSGGDDHELCPSTSYPNMRARYAADF